MPARGVNTGWTNSCGQELFTLGWIGCGGAEQPQVQKKKTRPYGGINDPYLEIAMREDEEILMLCRALIETMQCH